MHSSPPEVLRCAALKASALEVWVAARGMQLHWVAADTTIPGSYWGDEEAGLIGDRLHVRPDTPVHSLLHELAHWLCMDAERRATVDTDACGSDTEEHAVCYLQALLAPTVPGYSRARLFADMDAWGYHFIQGSAAAWFDTDSDDALAYLRTHGLVDAAGAYTGGRRQH
jgi:hypothetical protein|tara:strand:- start:23541 stop:24047 length:507 start_codon:yes stop_codon:yes gene_type:complete